MLWWPLKSVGVLSAEKRGPLQATWKRAGRRGGWLEHPFRADAAAAPGRHIWSGRHIWLVHWGATEGPPGELGKAGLGLTARYKAAMFWRAAYHVRDY